MHHVHVARFIRRWRLRFAVATIGTYLIAIPLTFVVFPDNNLWLALWVLISGLLAALTSLADLLTDEPKPE